MRLGLFGGSFDPVHNGHLRLAERCAEQARLDEVWFIPAAVQPFKQHGPVASDADRVAMLRLATEERPDFVVSTIEIDRGGVSYTIDTIRDVRRQRPDAELFFLMGADTLRDVPDWRESDEVLRLMTPLVVERPGVSVESGIEHLRVEMAPMEVSSSAIRDRLGRGESVGGLVPESVVNRIRKRELYR